MSVPRFDDRGTRKSKEDLLRAGLFAPSLPQYAVPDVITRSWRRCVGIAAPLARTDVPYVDAVDRDGQLVAATRPVFERIGEHLAGTGVAFFLSDSHGQIVLRHLDDRRLRDVYDSASAAEGFDFSETAIGTNGLGTVIEERRPVFVRGAEHYNEALETLTCAGVPIFRPYTRQVVGSFALACRSDATNALMYGMAIDIGRQIETALAGLQGDLERALAQAYLTANQSRRDPVIVVSEHAALANTLGLHHLNDETHALLWQHLQSGSESAEPRRASVPLAEGYRDAVVEQVAGRGRDTIYLLRLLPAAIARSPKAGRARPAAIGALDALHPVSSVARQLRASAAAGMPLVIAGAPGTGKLAAARAVLREAGRPDPLVVDVAVAARRPGAWYEQAAVALDAGRGVVLIHLCDLPTGHVNLVKALMARAGETSLAVTVDLTPSLPHVLALVGQLAGTPVQLPELPAMHEHIPQLARRMLAELPFAHPGSYLSTAALQALIRAEWPGNLTELHRTIEQAARRAGGPTIDVRHLPPRFQISARRHTLSLMESAERDAIIATLRQMDGNRTRAAAALGIGRSTLYRKMRSYRILS